MARELYELVVEALNGSLRGKYARQGTLNGQILDFRYVESDRRIVMEISRGRGHRVLWYPISEELKPDNISGLFGTLAMFSDWDIHDECPREIRDIQRISRGASELVGQGKSL